MAASERNRLGLGDGSILNLRQILENEVGLRIFYADLPSNLAGIFTTVVICPCILIHDKCEFFGLRQAEEGAPVSEVCRKMGISEQTLYRWKKKFRG